MPQAEHTSRRASAAAAAAASDMVPINSKKLSKRPAKPVAAHGGQRRVQPDCLVAGPATEPAPSSCANGAGSSNEPTDLESQVEGMESAAADRTR